MRVFVVVFLASIAVGTAWENSKPKIGDQLAKKLATDVKSSYDILIYVNGQPKLRAIDDITQKSRKTQATHQALLANARATQKDLRQLLEKEEATYNSLYIGNIIAVQNVSKALITRLAKRKDVKRILGDPEVVGVPPGLDFTKQQNEPAATDSVGANIEAVKATDVWKKYNTKGEGIVIGAQDTGIDWDHPALKNSYRGWVNGTADHDYNWHDAIQSGSGFNKCGRNIEEPCDDQGHGTHTLGTVIGDDGDENQIGVSPGAKWIGCRNMDNGVGKPSTYIECFQYFLAPWPYGGDPERDGRPELAADVINNSWGCPKDEGCEGDEFVEVLGALKSAGILVVASAGNEGPDCSTLEFGPAHHSELVLSVGALDHRNDRIASFSSRGPSVWDGGLGPHISAPGVSIRSSTPGGSYQSFLWSGTSMAGPHVAGAAALLWAAIPELKGDVDETIRLFKDTARPLESSQSCGGVAGSEIPNNTYGYGALDALKTLDTASEFSLN